jgi:serine protease Do
MTIRRDRKESTIAATIAEMPESQQQAGASPSGRDEEAASLGLQLSSITPELRSQLRIPKEVEGVVITKVAPDSPVAAIGIAPGDVIVSVAQEPAKTPQQAADALKQAAATGNILLLLNRHGTSQFVALTVTPGVGSSAPRR